MNLLIPLFRRIFPAGQMVIRAVLATIVLLLPVLPTLSWSRSTIDEAELWQALRDGTHVAIIRHALAPGIGDPEAFDLDDCSTQRNLSEAGRAQARRLGDRFRRNGIESAAVYSSEWCRCVETAKLLELGPVSTVQVLNSFFRDYQRADQQTAALNAWLDSRQSGGPLVLVSHQVNISALVGGGAGSGEMVVFRREPDGDIAVLGRIATPH